MIIKFKYFAIKYFSHILILFWVVLYFVIGFKTTR